ncbi:MAG: SDR family oxidoreductase [Candidatus Hydrogenedentota bacterium]|nr:MAG: SDR family oxidoreductase [Candidatus Hydrogenedentota bacterium]
MAVVLITGCSRGIGMLTALQFSRKGDTVFASMRDISISGDIEKAAQDEGLAIEVVQLDVTDDASVRAAVAKVLDSAGRTDVLVNNAGFGMHTPIEDADLKEARLMFETNFFGPLRLIQAVLPAMREQRSGVIVNVSSLSGVIAEPYNGVYAASKHALEALSESLYFECHPFGIRVAVIEPGGHDTRGYWRSRKERRFAEDSPHREYGERFMEAVRRLPGAEEPGDPQEVAEAIYSAVYTDEPKLRYLVGKEADIARLRRRLSDEEFEQAMRTALDIWD